MTSPVPPPGAPNAGPAQAVPPATATAAAANLPPGLANLTVGAVLQATVAGPGGHGQVLIQTPNGVLSLATALALTPGSKITLQVQTVGPQIQLAVLSVNQQPVQGGAAAAAKIGAQPLPPAPAPPAPPAPSATPPPAAAAQAQSPAVLVSTGRALTATLIQPAVKPGAPAPAQGLPPSPFTASVPRGAAVSVSTPGAAAAPAIAAGTPPQEALQILSALFARPGREAAVPQKGARLPVRIAAFEPNPAADPQSVLRGAAQARPAAQLLAGTVLGQGAAGQLRVTTPLGQFSLPAGPGLPPQSHVVLELLGPLQPPPAAELPSTGAVVHGRGWPALEEALAVLARSDPAQFRHVSENLTPRTEGGLAKTIALTAAAIKSGDVAAFLGERALHALAAAGRHDLVARLGEDFRQLAMPAHDTSGGEWRSYLIPVHDGSQLNFIRMYARRRNRQKQDAKESESASRFIVEVDLSRLGAMQFDGLVKAKQFDLVIRSRAALDSRMRRDIGQIFSDSTASSGFMGSVSFQAGARFAELPARAAAPGTGLDV